MSSTRGLAVEFISVRRASGKTRPSCLVILENGSNPGEPKFLHLERTLALDSFTRTSSQNDLFSSKNFDSMCLCVCVTCFVDIIREKVVLHFWKSDKYGFWWPLCIVVNFFLAYWMPVTIAKSKKYIKVLLHNSKKLIYGLSKREKKIPKVDS